VAKLNCENGGEWNGDGSSTNTCNCSNTLYTGETCQTLKTVCDSNGGSWVSGTNTCSCNGGYASGDGTCNVCADGYTSVGGVCVAKLNCDSNGGSWVAGTNTCSCSGGYATGDGTCNVCAEGYTSVGGVCVANLECDLSSTTWNSTDNTCACKEGYKKEEDATSCVPVICPANSQVSGDHCVFLNPKTKSFSEGKLSGLITIAQTSNIITSNLKDIIDTTYTGDDLNINQELVSFGGITSGRATYNTGSYVKINNYSGIAGLSLGNALDVSGLTLGVFIEAGLSNYETHNEFKNTSSGQAISDVNANGDNKYYGAGILGRVQFEEPVSFEELGYMLDFDLEEAEAGNIYLETSFHAGNIITSYDSKDYVGADESGNFTNAKYNSKSSYYGFHVGVGDIYIIDEDFSLDTFARYIRNVVSKDNNVDLGTGEKINFKDAISSRIQLGTRFNGEFSFSLEYDDEIKFKWYLGASYDMELEGEQEATIKKYTVDKPSLKGNTIEVEAGIKTTYEDLDFHLNINNSTGIKNGMGGGMLIKYKVGEIY
jgi:hypothetical protein